ncbi:DegT/DnrJ/EryC1/StrS family aminotransferase [Sphingoaurantiacus capsulatus]|uniref:DegT/DnrJ/EryC1/StrS family aminotransferase n=1 Tax=Sphingoaurantiacus capsulatus TaxID=1771310 RepID=A0ABV7X8F1_9SPHN
MSAAMIPFIDLKSQYQALKPEVQARINRVLDHGQYIMGPEVRELEERLEAYTGARHCITVASGTEALLISLMALGIGRGDEVITTPFTFAATVEVIALLGATPVFVDIKPETCNIDAALIEAAITPRTKAIMPVSLYGQLPDMDAINAVAARHGDIPVIEDAAQSFGAEYRGRKSCNLSTIGCTSFFPSKPLGCYGDGGAIFTSDDALAQACREIRVHGQSKRYTHTRIGVGGRMDTLQCAIVLAKMDRFEREVELRAQIGDRYRGLIQAAIGNAPAPSAEDVGSPLQGLRLLSCINESTHVHAQFTVACPDREAVAAKLAAKGVPTAVHYPIPLHLQPAYAGLGPATDAPISEWMSQYVMSLPMGPDLTASDQDRVVQALVEATA